MNRIDQLKIFLKDQPNDAFLKHALALEYVKISDDEAAQLLFEENKKEQPEYVATYYHLGQLLIRNNQTEAAIQVWEEGMKWAKHQKDDHSYRELRSIHEEWTFD